MTVSKLPVPPLAGGDPPGPNGEAGHRRWRPTRAGIVNVWRYFDEVFTFHRGRLLLRGPNGSGKSKALELLLPYLLDASLRPSRLSTFGGQERTMHWNLMGDAWTAKSRVGYVWVEFGRPEGQASAGEWFTLGARLQASANSRRVDATYFTTSQRVGVDGGLALVGEGNRPLTRADLEEAIGTSGRVHRSSADHRRAVLQTLYRGFDDDKYEALIGALLQLRIPKLSEHLDPAELSVLLSRSLPPLDQQAVGEIAEGFEKLDHRREDLAALERDVLAAKRLADRQRRYAQRVVRAAAADLISATNHMDDCTREERRRREELDAADAERRDLEAADASLAEEHDGKSQRAEALRRSEAYSAHLTLADWRKQLERLRDQARAARERADRAEQRAGSDRQALAAAAAEVERLTSAVERAAGEAERAAARSGLSAAFEAALGTGVEEGRGVLGAAVDARERHLEEVRTALDAHRQAIESRDRAGARLTRRHEEHEQAAHAREDRARDCEAALDALRIRLRDWAESCSELPVAEVAGALEEAAEDLSAVLAIVSERAAGLEQALAAEEAALSARRVALEADRDERQAERDHLTSQPHVEPDPPPSRTTDRAGMAGAPLWRLVRFADGVDPAAQAAVEAALQDSGLLDAWVRPDGSVHVSGGAHDRFAGPDLTAPAPGPSLDGVLVPEPDGPVPGERVRAVLAAVAWGPVAGGHPAAVGTDGSWRLASLTGSWSKPEPEFIGPTARERARQRRLAELDRLIAGLERELAGVRAGIDAVAARRAQAAAEGSRVPSHRPLHEARARLGQAEATLASGADAVAEAAAELEEAEQAVTGTLRTLAALASEHGLPTDRDGLDEVGRTLRAFRRACDAWLDVRRRLEAAESRRASASEACTRSEADAAEASGAAASADREARNLAIRLQTLETEAGSDARRVLAEVSALEARLQAIADERGQNQSRLRALAGRAGKLGALLESEERARAEAVAARDSAGQALRRLGVIGLAADAGVEVDLATVEGVRPTLEAARAVAAEFRDVPYDRPDVKKAESGVAEVLHQVRETLAARADLSVEPDEEGRSVLVAAVDGLRLGASGLHARLAADLASAREELTEYEQELFDRTLAGSARRQVADRIRQARDLVDRMNLLLGRVQTASKMRVQLRWQVDPQLSGGMREARNLILRDPDSLSEADRQALHEFFRARIEEVRSAEGAASWEEHLLGVLDYRAWHTFVAQIDRGDGDWQPVTKRTHGQLSGGERAIALHLPLFAAAAAHYAAAPEAPRVILLDEVFVGVDGGNRGQLLDLVVRLDLDAVMTSDHEWCTYTEVDGIAIHQLITADDGDEAVTTARFVWDGHRLVSSEPEQQALQFEHAGA